MLKYVHRTNNKYKNNDLVNVIKSGLSDLKNEIENIDKKEKEIKKPAEIVADIREFSNQNQQGKVLKILTPDQILRRLPICLAQLKGGNNLQNHATIVFFVLFRKIHENNLQPFNQHYLKMETIFMNTENSKTNEPHRLRLSLADKANLKISNKNIPLGNISICYTWKHIKSAYNNNKFEVSAPSWNDIFYLIDGSDSTADIQDYFEFIMKKKMKL